jgi:hypothetical protein
VYPGELSELQASLLGLQSSLLSDEQPQLVSELGAYDAVVYRLLDTWENDDEELCGSKVVTITRWVAHCSI